MCIAVYILIETMAYLWGKMMLSQGGGPSDFFGSEILAQSDFFGVYERRRHLFGSWKNNRGIFWVVKKGLRDFLDTLKNVVIFWGRQIMKL